MKRLVLSVLIIGMCVCSNAQKNPTKEELNAAGNLQSQFDYLWGSSVSYNNSRVVKNRILNQFNSNVQDSLNNSSGRLANSSFRVDSLDREIRNLSSSVSSLEAQRDDAEKEKNSFDFIGMNMTKSSFRILFFIVASTLLILTLLSFFRMRSKASQAHEDKSRFVTLESEFEDYKKRAREKEQVLARQLQDEINKNL